MGRRRKQVKCLQKGLLYFVDRRISSLWYYRKILSRQNSVNEASGNYFGYDIPKSSHTTLLVCKHEVIFGRSYVQVLLANPDRESIVGYMTLESFLGSIQGKPRWAPNEPE